MTVSMASRERLVLRARLDLRACPVCLVNPALSGLRVSMGWMVNREQQVPRVQEPPGQRHSGFYGCNRFAGS